MKKYLSSVLRCGILVMAAAVIFGGCMPVASIDIEAENLPQGMHMELLVQPQEDYVDKAREGILQSTGYLAANDEPVDYEAFLEIVQAAGDTHIYRYDEDGWYSLQYFAGSLKNSSFCRCDGSIGYHLDGFSTEEDFVEVYPELRLAVLDDRDRVVKVSEAVDMTPEGKYGYFAGLSYDFESNTLTPDKPQHYLIGGLTPDGWLMVVMVLLLLLDILILPLIIIMAVVKEKAAHPAWAVVFWLASAANIVFVVGNLILMVVPAFNIDDSGISLTTLLMVMRANVPWIGELVAFLLIRKHARQKKFEQLSSPQTVKVKVRKL